MTIDPKDVAAFLIRANAAVRRAREKAAEFISAVQAAKKEVRARPSCGDRCGSGEPDRSYVCRKPAEWLVTIAYTESANGTVATVVRQTHFCCAKHASRWATNPPEGGRVWRLPLPNTLHAEDFESITDVFRGPVFARAPDRVDF
jgi:hypothetical protein